MELTVITRPLEISTDNRMYYQLRTEVRSSAGISIARIFMGEFAHTETAQYQVYICVDYAKMNYRGDFGINLEGIKCKEIYLNKKLVIQVFRRLFKEVTALSFSWNKAAIVYLLELTDEQTITERGKIIRQLFKGF
jgi:hypothetical protein